ncbi:MAG: hypothetical protein HYZ62_01170 [Candidatus Andersenbacteria bacterium]|nr:hypothetical protein [Candidatus Andersenbacteria bacterium]
MPSKEKNPTQTIKLTMRWLFLMAAGMLGLGLIGGILGAQLVAPAGTLQPDGSDPIISTIQQVTVSPNKQWAQVALSAARSVVMLRQVSGGTISYPGMGVIVTSDGLIATTASIRADQMFAIDEAGKATVLALVGSDPVYGITYLRLPANVAVPIGFSDIDNLSGATLLGVKRSLDTLALAATLFQAQTYTLANQDNRPGVQRLIHGTESESFAAGEPLLDEEGNLAGVVVTPDKGLAMTAADIKQSLNRVIANRREVNPFTAVGLDVTYTFVDTPESGRVFVARARSLETGSPAVRAGFKNGDDITHVGTAALAFTTPFVQLLGQDLPLQFTVLRQGIEKILVMEAAPAL